MRVELKKLDFVVQQQRPITVHYDGEEVGEYFADLIVNNTIIIELKAAAQICHEHEVQLLNYLKATDMEVGLLLNFGTKPNINEKSLPMIRNKE